MKTMISIPLFGHIWVNQRHFTSKVMVLRWFVHFCTWSQQKFFFNVSDCNRKGMNINNRRKWQNPPRVVKAKVHEKCSSEVDSDSEFSNNAVSDEDLVLDRELSDPQGTSNSTTPSIFSVNEPKRLSNLQLIHWTVITFWRFKRMIPTWILSDIGQKKANCPKNNHTIAKAHLAKQISLKNYFSTKKAELSLIKRNIHLNRFAYHKNVSLKLSN